MKKSWLISGISLLLIGLIVTSVMATWQEQKVISRRTVDGGLDKEEVSGNFTHGNRLSLVISPAQDWSMILDETDEYPFKHFAADITIVNPYGGETQLEAIFVSPPNYQTGKTSLTLFLVKPLSNNAELIFEKSNEKTEVNGTTYYNSISAIVKYDGFYNVSIYPVPHALNLYEETLGKEYPFLSLVPVGVTVMAIGAIQSGWTLKKHKAKRHVKKLKILYLIYSTPTSLRCDATSRQVYLQMFMH